MSSLRPLKALGLICAFSLSVIAPALASDIRISTPQGDLLGDIRTEEGVASYKGIPYAVPPVGIRRWTAAQAAPAWMGLRSAKAAGPACIQPSYPETLNFGPGKSQPVLYAEPSIGTSEDCLYLNVWTPATDRGTELAPVMVWIHGGGFVFGSGDSPTYDATALAKKGVVVVTINYRLGVFGFFAHPELSAENPRGVSANFGITDQIEALNWVKRNIAAYGGDPSNVTIFGESAGSWAVSVLMATPLSKGLFHKAIGESGAYFYSMPELKVPGNGLPAAEVTGKAFGDQVAPGGLAALRSLSAQDLLNLTAPGPAIPNFGQFLVVDGQMFERPVRETYLRGEQSAVPVMVGFNSDEGSGLSDFGVVAQTPKDRATYVAEVKARYGDLAPAYLRQYPADSLTDAVFNAYRDSEFGWRMQHWASSMAAVKSPAWLYYMSHVSSTGEAVRWVSFGADQRRLGAFHASEIAYVFNNPSLQLLNSATPKPADIALADTMSDYWVNFARTSNPNGSGRPVWSPYTNKSRNYMGFANGAVPAVNLLPGSLELHRQIDDRRAKRLIAWDGGQAGLLGRTQPIIAAPH